MEPNTVLIVDDDRIICEIIISILEQFGFHAEAVHSGEEALEMLEKNRFLAVVTDLKMGEVNGFEVTRHCKMVSPETVVVMMTGSCETKHKQTAYECGASAFLAKPFDMDDLLNSLPQPSTGVDR